MTDKPGRAWEDYISYDKDSGGFVWKKSPSSFVKAGSPAGCLDPQGYRYIGLNGHHYLAHRVAWFLTYGEWPKDQIDHINGNKSDNRICNLRDVGQIDNGRNQKMPVTNTSGVVGIVWLSKRQKWAARIKVNRVQKTIGIFNTLFDAVAARKSSEIANGFHANHGKAIHAAGVKTR